MNTLLQNAQSLQNGAQWWQTTGTNCTRFAQLGYTLCTLLCAKMQTMCQSADNLPNTKKHFATCKWSGGVGDWAMVRNRQLLWAQVVHRVHTELSHRSTLYCNYCRDIHKLCFAGTRAHSCWAKTNAHNIHIWPWKLSPPAQMEHKCKWGQLSEITSLEA